jgi:hypothetical protein
LIADAWLKFVLRLKFSVDFFTAVIVAWHIKCFDFVMLLIQNIC